MNETISTTNEPDPAVPEGTPSTPSLAGQASEREPAAGAESTPMAPEPILSANEIEELRRQSAKAQEHWDRYLRAAADFENYRKRAVREKQDASRQAIEGLLTRLLPVLDNFDGALAAMAGADSAAASVVDPIRAGVVMIHSQLKAVMVEAGLEEVEALGKPFDPTWHEAVSQLEVAEVPEGQVLQQLRKGYRCRDRLLRAAMVVVSRKPAG